MGVMAASLPTGGVAVLVGAGAVVGMAVAPAYALAVIPFAVPFGGLMALPLGGGIGATEVGTVLAGAAWVVHGARRHELIIQSRALALFLAVFLSVATLSAAGAPDLILATKELAKWAEFGLMAFAALSLLSAARPAFVIVGALMVAGTAEAMYGVYQAVVGSGPTGFLLGAGTLRAFGHFGQPNPYAVYLSTVLILAAGVLLAFIVYDRTGLRKPLILALAAAAACLSYAVLASFSRSALISLIVASCAMLVAHSRQMVAILALLAGGAALLGLLGAFGLLPPVVTSRFAVLLDNFSLFDARDVTLTSANFALVQRMAIWQAAWAMFQDNPLLGVGIGNFDLAYRDYALHGWPQLPGHAHNYYLNLLAEGGILLLGSYLALLSSLYWISVRNVLRLKQSFSSFHDPAAIARYGLTLGGVGLLALISVHHLFDNLYVHGMLAQVGLILGLSLAAARIRPEPAARTTRQST